MKIEEIRANAPSGATHYQNLAIIERIMYYKKLNGEIFWFSDCDNWISVRVADGVIYEKGLRGRIKPL